MVLYGSAHLESEYQRLQHDIHIQGSSRRTLETLIERNDLSVLFQSAKLNISDLGRSRQPNDNADKITRESRRDAW